MQIRAVTADVQIRESYAMETRRSISEKQRDWKTNDQARHDSGTSRSNRVVAILKPGQTIQRIRRAIWEGFPAP
jgi:hypothetical protein